MKIAFFHHMGRTVMVFRVLWPLLIGSLISVSTVSAQGQSPLEISFKQLKGLAAESSPEIRIIEESYRLATTERDVDMQWTNPDVTYWQEYAGGEREHYLLLSKVFEMPWVYSHRKNTWQAYLEGAQLEKQAKLRDLFLRVKGRYVELRLLETQLGELKEACNTAKRISDVARKKMQEGALSGLEEQVIRMAVLNLQANVLKLEDKKQEAGIDLKTLLGIEPSRQIRPATDIGFRPVHIDDENFYLSQVVAAPGNQAQRKHIKAREHRVQMELARILPTVAIEAGYKRVSPDHDGYVAGVTIPLPVFNWNRAQKNKQAQEMGILMAKLRRSEIRLAQLVSTTLDNVKTYAGSLQSMAPSMEHNSSFLKALSVAFEEGQISLSDLLSSLQVFVENNRNYNDLLIEYYRLLFLLESVSGVEIVSFGTKGDDL